MTELPEGVPISVASERPVSIIHPVPTMLKHFVKEMTYRGGSVLYTDADDGVWDDLGSLLQGAYCALGMPVIGDHKENLRLVGGVLLHLRDRNDDGYSTPAWLATNPLINFIYYWLESRDFSECDGFLPGRLTEKGIQLLLALAYWDERDEAESGST